jgi:micrococcal nuclease
MSKHWPPKTRAGTGRLRLPSRRSPRLRVGEVRLVLLGGILAGLIWAQVPAGTPAVAAGAAHVGDPWAVAITDGDTFRYRGEKIRIADIDAPEVRGRCPHEIRLAARATDRMEALLQAGPFEMRRLDRDEDRYGRKLRVVLRDGRSLGDQLVAEGLARTWTGRREPWC